MLRKNWWKLLSFIFLLYTFTAGFLGKVPAKPILNETIRNLYFHVAMWFGMMIFFIVSVIYSIKYLRHTRPSDDIYAVEFARTGIVFGLLASLQDLSGPGIPGVISGAMTQNNWEQPSRC